MSFLCSCGDALLAVLIPRVPDPAPRPLGNIRVFCRVRPVSPEEHSAAESRNMVSFDSDDDAVLYLSNKGKTMTFDLDKVFPPQATQEEVSWWLVTGKVAGSIPGSS